MRFVTMATPNYRSKLERLLFSLARIHPDATVDVFANSVSSMSDLQSTQVRLELLPQIEQLGAKRAKFAMYEHAIDDGRHADQT